MRSVPSLNHPAPPIPQAYTRFLDKNITKNTERDYHDNSPDPEKSVGQSKVHGWKERQNPGLKEPEQREMPDIKTIRNEPKPTEWGPGKRALQTTRAKQNRQNTQSIA